MSIIIEDERIVDLARRLAALTGETMTEAVRIAIHERLKRQEANSGRRPLRERLMEIANHCASLPVVRERAEDEILGYDERGRPRPTVTAPRPSPARSPEGAQA